jgi:hypothetical protein
MGMHERWGGDGYIATWKMSVLDLSCCGTKNVVFCRPCMPTLYCLMSRILEQYCLGSGPWWFAAFGLGAGEKASLGITSTHARVLKMHAKLSQTSHCKCRNRVDCGMELRQCPNVA